MEDMVFPRLGTLETLFEEVRKRLAKSAHYSVRREETTLRCVRLRKNGKTMRNQELVVDTHDGSCTLDGVALNMYLSQEETEALAGKAAFRIGGRPKRAIEDEMEAQLVPQSFPEANGIVMSMEMTTGETFYLESALRTQQIPYDHHRRILVSKKTRSDVYNSLRSLNLIGKSAPSVHVVESGSLFKKPIQTTLE
jgi:hypothetical protein